MTRKKSPEHVLITARRVSNVIESGIRQVHAEYDSQDPAVAVATEHELAGFYLVGVLGLLEGNYTVAGLRSMSLKWVSPPKDGQSQWGFTQADYENLVCLRNAFTHNDCDLSLNHDKSCGAISRYKKIPGVAFGSSTAFVLEAAFVPHIRLFYLAVADHFDGWMPRKPKKT